MPSKEFPPSPATSLESLRDKRQLQQMVLELEDELARGGLLQPLGTYCSESTSHQGDFAFGQNTYVAEEPVLGIPVEEGPSTHFAARSAVDAQNDFHDVSVFSYGFSAGGNMASTGNALRHFQVSPAVLGHAAQVMQQCNCIAHPMHV